MRDRLTAGHPLSRAEDSGSNPPSRSHIQAQQDIFERSVSFIASSLEAATGKKPLLYGPDNQPLPPDSRYAYRRAAARRDGTLRTWIPRRLSSRQAEATERHFIVERSVDLANSDPNAAGVVDTFATTIVGPGLMPLPAIDSKASGLSREEISRIHALQRAIYRTWHPIADAGGRMTFGAIQYLIERNMMVYGEYLVLVRMLDTGRPYYLSLQVVNPQRLRTPIDLWNNPSIKDGVELGANGEPVAYWIKKSTTSPGSLPDTSANFLRVPARTGHRKNVFHGFIQTEPEQVRGWPSFAPALKFFKDLSDYLDAELVSNIVTAALALFIQIGGNDAYGLANQLATLTDEATLPGAQPTRYQELVPGSIMYGNQGETPHLISPNRPGQTFEPFTRTIKKGIAYSLNQPYAALFKDTDGVSFAGFRSAMLEAWRTYEQRRTWLGEAFCAPVWTMLMEEAYLRGEWDVPDFYEKMAVYTNSRWQGPPKGDIEPVKQMQTDVLAIRNNLKTRSASINERGGDLLETFDTLQEEQEMMEERNLTEEAVSLPTPGGGAITREAGSVTPPEEEQASLSAISEVLARVEEMAATIDDIRGGMAL